MWVTCSSIECVDYRAGLRGYVQFNKCTHTQTHTHTRERGGDVRLNARREGGRGHDRRKKICVGIIGTRTDWVLKGEGGGMMTPLLQYVARFDGRGGFVGLGGGDYKESWSWCSLFVGFPSLFGAPSDEQLALPV